MNVLYEIDWGYSATKAKIRAWIVRNGKRHELDVIVSRFIDEWQLKVEKKRLAEELLQCA